MSLGGPIRYLERRRTVLGRVTPGRLVPCHRRARPRRRRAGPGRLVTGVPGDSDSGPRSAAVAGRAGRTGRGIIAAFTES